jgi:aminobenzoyl-glutamate utilization protein B
MKCFLLLIVGILNLCCSWSQVSGKKQYTIQYIDSISKTLIAINDSIWNYAEPSLKEFKSSSLLIKLLRDEGFIIQENAGGISTQFVATYGVDKPVIGLFGEYDADPGASNKTVPYHEPIISNGYGHGGGHNLLGVGSLGAAMAIKKLIQQGKLKCTIKYFGTTAEGGIGGKTFLARHGFFNDLDFSLYWHPSPITKATTTGWDSMIEMNVSFYGKKYDVFKTTSTQDADAAMINFLYKFQDYKKDKIKNTRLNYIIQNTSNNINSPSDTARVFVRIMSLKQKSALAALDSIKSILASIKQTQPDVFTQLYVIRAKHQFVTNVAAMEVVNQNMQMLGPIRYTEEEQTFAKRLQESSKVSPTGLQEKIFSFENSIKSEGLNGNASDIGDASWFAPEVYFVVACLPNVAMHQWPGAAVTNHSIGIKGMLYAAKVLSLTIIDYVEEKQVRQLIAKDFVEQTAGYRYKPLIDLEFSK